MRFYQVTHREGEKLAQIDWSHNFWQHFSTMCSNDDYKRERMERQIYNLFVVERLFLQGKRLRVREGDYWHDLLDIGMYDGWPYWRPVPAILVSSPLGSGEWRHFPCVDEWKERS